MPNLKAIIVHEIVGNDCRIIDTAHHIGKLTAAALRQPDPPDAEVWRCPCCDQIVDRATMAAAEA